MTLAHTIAHMLSHLKRYFQIFLTTALDQDLNQYGSTLIPQMINKEIEMEVITQHAAIRMQQLGIKTDSKLSTKIWFKN